MAECMIFHYRAADNILTRLNPNTKLLSVIIFSIVVSASDPALVFILSVLVLFLAVIVRLPFRSYLKESVFFLVLAALMALSSYINHHCIIMAAASASGFLSMLLASSLLMDTTMPDELSRSLGSALSHIMGKGAYVISTVLEITISMIPLIIDSTVGMYEARKARGDSFLSHPVSSISGFTASVISDLLDKAGTYTDALYARGYNLSSCRSVPCYHLRDWVIIIADILLLLLWVLMID